MNTAHDERGRSDGPAPEDPVTARALAVLGDRAPGAVTAAVLEGRHPHLVVAPDRLREVCRLLRDHDDLRFDACHLITGVDRPKEERIDVVYHLVSYTRREDADYRRRPAKNDPWIALQVRLPRSAPEIPSVADIWTGADWHERETFDLVGVVFTGRADLRRILLPDDWPGHPLRKDWVYPVSYHGVPIIPPEAQ